MPTGDALTSGLADHVAGKIRSGDWSVIVVAGGPALKPASKFLRGFEIKAGNNTVVIVCERKPVK